MNMFSLSEVEYNALQSVRGQLNLVSGLLCAKGANSSLFDAEDLNDFLSKQVDSMRGVMRAVEERYDLERDTPCVNYTHWLYAIRIAAGDANLTPMGSEARVTEALMQAARIDPDMHQALDVWREVLGYKQKPEPTAPAKKTAQRKRDKLTAKTVEVVS